MTATYNGKIAAIHNIGQGKLVETEDGELFLVDENDVEVLEWDGQTAHVPSLTTEALENASTYYTATGDSELDAVLSASGDRNTIHIGDEDLTDARTGDDSVPRGRHFVFPGGRFRDVNISGEWEVSERTRIEGAGIREDMTVAGGQVTLEHCSISGASVTVQSDDFIGYALEGGSITFESGTSSGIVDVSTGVSVTDSGNNTVGDIA